MADETISIGPLTAVYPRLKTPDTKFDELGQYKADGLQSLADAEPNMKALATIFKKHTGKAPNKADNTMWSMELDDEGEQTGNVFWKLRVKNKLRKKDGQLWDRRPALFDASLRPVDVNPYGGSKYVVSADIYCWTAGAKVGVSLQPLGVQILELVEGSGPNASAMGFKAQEGYAGSSEYADDEPEEDSGSEGADAGEEEEDEGDY